MTRHLPLIMQSEIAECGLACLAMIMNYFGRPCTLSEIRRKTPATLKGLNLLQLKQIAENNGFNANVLRVESTYLANISQPCLLHWNTNHFLVFKKFKKGLLYAHDPAKGLIKLNLDQINQYFTGIILELIPTPVTQSPIPSCKSKSLLLTIFFSQRYLIAKLFLLSLITQCCLITSIQLTQYSLDKIAISSNICICLIIILGILSLKMIETASIGIRSMTITKLSVFINKTFAITLIQHLMHLPITFFEKRHTGEILSRFGSIEKIRSSITEGFIECTIDALIAVIMLITIIHICPPIAVMAFISLFLLIIVRFINERHATHYQDEALHARTYEVSTFLETIKALPAIKIFSSELTRINTWMSKLVDSINSLTKIAWHKSLYDFSKNLILNTDLIATLVISHFALINHQLSVGMLYALFAYRGQFFHAIEKLSDKMQQFRLLKLHASRMQDIILEPLEFNDIQVFCNTNHTKFKHPTLAAVNLGYHYPNESTPLLNNLNFTIKQGECVVITGASGCGKSTLLKLLMGLTSPTKGQLFINNTPIYPFHIKCYRKYISAVLQDDILLSGTIADNICFFDPKINNRRMIECAKLACIYDEINANPMSFNTLVGDMGSTLSGGQKQRIRLARALYAQPSILFLDEASSHLDVTKEYEVNQNLRKLNITIIMVAHRKETIAIADRVIKL